MKKVTLTIYWRIAITSFILGLALNVHSLKKEVKTLRTPPTAQEVQERIKFHLGGN